MEDVDIVCRHLAFKCNMENLFIKVLTYLCQDLAEMLTNYVDKCFTKGLSLQVSFQCDSEAMPWSSFSGTRISPKWKQAAKNKCNQWNQAAQKTTEIVFNWPRKFLPAQMVIGQPTRC